MDVDLITIVALIALPEEFETFQQKFPVALDHSTDRQVCLEHKIDRVGYRLISILAEQMGSQSASISATLALEKFNPDLFVVIGIAGGISADVKLGDVCISNEIIDVLQNNKVTDKSGGMETALAPDFYNVDAELVASFAFLRVHPDLQSSYQAWAAASKTWVDEPQEDKSENSPQMIIGPIACGPVVSSKAFNKKIQDLHRKIIAIETESGGVFGHISRRHIPAISIRGISDLADRQKTKLEKDSKGAVRKIAMANACNLLQVQLANQRFMNVAASHASRRTGGSEPILFQRVIPVGSIVATLDSEIKAHLRELSSEYRARPDGFYLPVPRIRKISFADDLAGRQLDSPENVVSCLESHDRILVRLPRSYPSQALGWSLAHSLLRQQIGGRVILPFVIAGRDVRPPRNGISALLPNGMSGDVSADQYARVIIIEEPPFESNSKMKFFLEEIEKMDAIIMILTKSEDNVTETDELISSREFVEYEIAPVSFSETAFFLEKSFDMTPSEAEVVAIRLDDTFRKFRLDAHPTYFAGLQEETLSALINANKRPELIQLAVDGLLTLAVAADKGRGRLSRTTRDRFLRYLSLKMAEDRTALAEEDLIAFAKAYLTEYKFRVEAGDFLKPFYDMGLLYISGGRVYFTHPYLESYILAQALREDSERAIKYFDPLADQFNYYAYDLYCELGPSADVISRIADYISSSLAEANRLYPDGHIYLNQQRKLATLSTPAQLGSLSKVLMSTAERMEQKTDQANLRQEKQRILDARRYVRVQVGMRQVTRGSNLPEAVSQEFSTLDQLSRSLSLAATTVGAGSESLSGDAKVTLGCLVLETGEKFSDLWTRNRLRTDFSSMRNDLLSDNNIWSIIEEAGADANQFDEIKKDLDVYIHSFELNFMLEPMGNVLWRTSALAGARVLGPVIDDVQYSSPIQRVIRSVWLSEVDPERGRESLKNALSDYNGSPLFRLTIASHLLWRVFWHHYQTIGAQHLVNSAKRALRPLGLAPAERQIEQAKKGMH